MDVDVDRAPRPAGRTSHSGAGQPAALRRYSLVGAAALMDGVSRAVRALPQRRRYLLSDAVTLPLAAHWSRRPVVERNMATALGLSFGHPRVRRLARESVRNYGRMAMDFLAVRTMDDREVLSWVTPVNAHYLDEALRARRGVIMVLSHAGSWDVAAAFAQAYGCQLNVVTESNWATELVAGSRKGHGVTLIPRDRSLRPMFRALARNEAVVMLSDIAKAGLQAGEIPFFGRPASFPLGPARLSRHTGAPILVVACMRQADGSYGIEPLPPLYADPAAPEEDAALDLTARIAAAFEGIIAAHPEQWYPFHPIWPERF